MIKLLLPDKSSSLLLLDKNVAKFKRIKVSNKELATNGGSSIYLKTSAIPGMDIYYNKDEEIRNSLLRIIPIYISKIIRIGYVCIARKGRMWVTNHCTSVTTTNKMENFKVDNVFDLMLVVDHKERTSILLGKDTRLPVD